MAHLLKNKKITSILKRSSDTKDEFTMPLHVTQILDCNGIAEAAHENEGYTNPDKVTV